MNFLDLILRILEMLIQLGLLIMAIFALYSWKIKLKGSDKYKLARELLEYFKKLRFLVYSKNGSIHQIYLNDILSV